jgi:hypothetical protein
MGRVVKGFFEWIWRLNGVIFLLVGGFLIAMLFRELPSWQSGDNSGRLHIADQGPATQPYRLGEFSQVPGTKILYAKLGSASEPYGLSSSAGAIEDRNILFFDTVHKKGQWLLSDNQHTIESLAFITDTPTPLRDESHGINGEGSTIALLLEVEPSKGSDTSKALEIAAPDGQGLTPIIGSIDSLLGYYQPSRDDLLVLYLTKGVARALDYDIAARKVRSDDPLLAADNSSNERAPH